MPYLQLYCICVLNTMLRQICDYLYFLGNLTNGWISFLLNSKMLEPVEGSVWIAFWLDIKHMDSGISVLELCFKVLGTWSAADDLDI